MLDWLRRYLRPPVMEDEDQQNRALLLNTTLLVILFLVLTIVPLVALIGNPEEALPTVAIGLVMAVGVIIMKWLLWRHYIRPVSWLISLILILAVGSTLYQFGGVRGINALSLTVILTIGSLLLRDRRAIAILTSLAILLGGLLYLGEAQGWLVYPPEPLLPQDLVIFVAALATLGLILAFAMTNLDTALARARLSERAAAEANEQLEAMNLALEARVAARTRALQLSADVSRRLSTILDQDELVRAVVNQLQNAFNYYHVHIYLLDDRGEQLKMVGGTGEPGRIMLDRGHTIEKGRGLVGQAAETNLPILVSNVSRDSRWLPNPLLPDTRAEIAVPIARADEVIGVLDVQHNIKEGLTGEDMELLQAMTNQIAVALQNARLYRQAQAQAAQEQLLNTITQRIQQATDVEQAMQVAVRELGRALDGQKTRVSLHPAREQVIDPGGA